MTHVHLLADGGVAEVEVWLSLVELVKVELLTFLVPRPGGAAKHAQLTEQRRSGQLTGTGHSIIVFGKNE